MRFDSCICQDCCAITYGREYCFLGITPSEWFLIFWLSVIVFVLIRTLIRMGYFKKTNGVERE